MRRFISALFVFTWAAGMTGCGPSIKLAPVEGKVVADSAHPFPLSSVRLTFVPDARKGNETPFRLFATAGPDGVYRVQSERGKGAPPGSYQVVVSQPLPTARTETVAFEIPEEYQSEKTTSLSIEVVEKASPGAYDLKLKNMNVKPGDETPGKTADTPPAVNKDSPPKLPTPTPTPSKLPPQTAPSPLADNPAVNLMIMMCQGMALLILVAEVVGAIALLVGAAGKSRKVRAAHKGEPTVEQQIEQALARNSASLWARVALLFAGAVTIIALLGGAEMMRLAMRLENLAERVEQKMDNLAQ